jgi:HSP20 family protein
MATNIMKRTNGAPGRPVRSLTGWVDEVLQNNLNRFFNDDYWGFDGLNTNGLTVPVNIRETDRSYELQLVAPGLKKEDFKLHLNGDMLTVSFEHKEQNEQDDKNEGWLRKEYRMQSFTRSFNLADTVDVQKINASYTDGILSVNLPKKEGAQRITKTIEIK